MRSILDKILHELKLVRGDASQDVTYQSERTFSSETAASQAFDEAVDRLFHVDAWSNLSTFTADFTLHDAQGMPKPNSTPAISDYILIQLPGPLPENWVRVVDRVQEENRAAFVVRPSHNPQQNNPQTIAHFFDGQAISTFMVERTGTTLTAFEIGVAESINNQGVQAGDRAAVNVLIAETGWLFYQQVQWKTLTDYLVGNE